MPASTSQLAGQVIIRRLDLHEQKRRDGLPTISVLCGHVGVCHSSLRDWSTANRRARALLPPDRLSLGAVVEAWLNQFTADHDLSDEATVWLAGRLGLPSRELGCLLRPKGPLELEMILDRALPLPSETGVERLCHWILQSSLDRLPGQLETSGLAERLDTALEAYSRPWARVLVALGTLIPPDRQPVLVWTCHGIRGDSKALTRLDAAARILTELAMAQPLLSIAMIVEPAVWNTYLEQAAESRIKALLRDSVLPVPDIIKAAAIRSTANRPGGFVRAFDRSISPSAENEASRTLRTRFHETLHVLEELDSDPDDPRLQDRARSAAERYLYERLESRPETAGLFQLNSALGFPFGANRPIEADLAAVSLNLVVEIDGYYHFQDLDSYRRDRRKDLELQKHGFLVIRVLAEDVVCRLEEVFETIVAAIKFRSEQDTASTGETT